ncbi:MAG: 2-hydroxyacid dehydrogenase [Pirellulales bacterium]|nr:2-hydroxyacid dehydrogenase [Pirellulales bacterium]
MKSVVVMAPVPVQIVGQWLASQTGRGDVQVQGGQGTTDADLERALPEAEIIVGDYTFVHRIDEQLLSASPHLRFIQQPSVGYEHIDVAACARRGVQVANTPGVNDGSVAEHALMMALMLLRHAVPAHQHTSRGEWIQSQLLWDQGLFELQDRVWGIIGMGRIGREVAKRAAAFGARIVYFDPQRLSPEVEAQLGAQYKPLEHLLRLADVVSLHTPLTEETRNLLNADRLALCKATALVINVSRGECLDEAALASRLRERKLGGAGLDVYSSEPIAADNPLLGLDNVVLTPHVAGATREVRGRVIDMAIGNVARVLRGEEARYLIC